MRTPDDEDAALETLEQALAAIRRDADRDEHSERVIRAMENRRAELIAAKLQRTSARQRPGSDDDSVGT